MKKHFRQTFCPTSRFRCIFKNSDSRKRKVFFRDRAIACDRMRSHANACDRMRSHAIACDRMVAVRSRVTYNKGTQKKSHPTQSYPPPHEHVTLPPAALPSLSMATSAMDPSHGAAPPHESCAGARGRGSCSRSPCFGRQKGTHRKIERWAGPRP